MIEHRFKSFVALGLMRLSLWALHLAYALTWLDGEADNRLLRWAVGNLVLTSMTSKEKSLAVVAGIDDEREEIEL